MQSSLTGKDFFEDWISRSFKVLGSQIMVGTLESGVFSVFLVGVDMINLFVERISVSIFYMCLY